VVIILSSSSGEIPEGKAKLLASRGYAALALGYFGKEGLPKKLKNIPLEYFEKTLNHLKTIKDIDGSKVTLYGSSRGAELALILASLLPQDVQAVIATVPSSVAYAGLTLLPSAAWLYEGRAFLPPMPMARPQLFKGEGLSKSHPAKMREALLQGMKNKNALDAATIPVEKICCPILLISSGDDQMWPSDVFAKRVIERVTKEKPYHTICHSHFPKAGHGITVPYLPIAEPLYYHPAVKLWFCTGGSKEDNALASEKSWQDILQFLKEHAQNTTETSR
jgi:dienelactone hydrolase